jgi:hypothetical protein
MPEANSATKLSLSFAKLVATPTETSWSQVYNAGNLFVCLSLTTETEDEETSLHALGKEIFNILQSEFFTLQEKNTAAIKAAIQTSLTNIPLTTEVCITLACFKDTTLLVFIAGSGKIVIKRKEKIGVLLTQQTSNRAITSASGFVENGDVFLLETGPFAKNISQDMVTQALELELPNDIAEALSPQIHQKNDGAQAAIVISYQGASAATFLEEEGYEEPEIQHKNEKESIPEIEKEQQTFDPTPTSYTPQIADEELDEEIEEPQKPRFRMPSLPKISLPLPKMAMHLNHRRRLFLNISLILAVLLVLSVVFTIKKYHDEKDQRLFQSIYPQAQQYYSEGKGLETVNASLSQQKYQKAESLLKNGEKKFDSHSKQYEQITNLLTQVEDAMSGGTTGETTDTAAVSPEPHSLLSVALAMSSGLAFGEDDNAVYVITTKAITSVSKNDGSKKDIIKNDNYWTSPQAVVPYQGNIYVLDQKKGVLKFVAGGGGFGESSYFKSATPDLSQATGMAIDGSVWLIFSDGTLMQFTKGQSNDLKISGLTKPLRKPTKIVTDITMENIYVLDPGSSRLVQFDKNGKYQNSYTASVISQAKDVTVSEKEKKALVLSGGKVYQLDLK